MQPKWLENKICAFVFHIPFHNLTNTSYPAFTGLPLAFLLTACIDDWSLAQGCSLPSAVPLTTYRGPRQPWRHGTTAANWGLPTSNPQIVEHPHMCFWHNAFVFKKRIQKQTRQTKNFYQVLHHLLQEDGISGSTDRARCTFRSVHREPRAIRHQLANFHPLEMPFVDSNSTLTLTAFEQPETIFISSKGSVQPRFTLLGHIALQKEMAQTWVSSLEKKICSGQSHHETTPKDSPKRLDCKEATGACMRQSYCSLKM